VTADLLDAQSLFQRGHRFLPCLIIKNLFFPVPEFTRAGLESEQKHGYQRLSNHLLMLSQNVICLESHSESRKQIECSSSQALQMRMYQRTPLRSDHTMRIRSAFMAHCCDRSCQLSSRYTHIYGYLLFLPRVESILQNTSESRYSWILANPPVRYAISSNILSFTLYRECKILDHLRFDSSTLILSSIAESVSITILRLSGRCFGG
jgi:hypothetical protein